MPWPLSQDYNEAVQSPQQCFSDAELRQTEARCNAIGLPMPRSGNFADVYEMTGAGGKKWAVKCFTRQVAGLRERYAAISAYLKQVNLPFMVDFSYVEQGIQVQGRWYPVLKMDWVEGLTLNEFVKERADQPQYLDMLCQIWQRLARRLREAKMAHCDLQHGNVLLVPGSKAASLAVKLIDYDGMWVPALADQKSGEVGHAAYQHPQRLREEIYSPEVDRFPHLVIYTALRSLMVGSRYLWNKYDNGDNLLFKQADLDAPGKSPLFAELVKLNDPELRTLVNGLAAAAQGPLDRAPLLDEVAAPGQPAPVAGRKSKPVPAATVEEPTSELIFAPAGTAARRTKRPAGKSYVGAALVGAAALAGLVVGGLMLAANRKPKDTGRDVVAMQPAPKTSEKEPVTGKKDPEPRKDPEPPPDPKGSALTKIYLANMSEYDVKQGPWPFNKGVNGRYGELPITVSGINSPNGLAMHPPSREASIVKYRLSTGAQVFQASVAVTTTKKAECPLTFQVWGDGKPLWTSKPIQVRDQVQDCKIKVAGVDVLELRVNCPDGAREAHAVWLEPHVLVDLQPVPNDAALAMAEKRIKEIYKADYAKRLPSERLGLAAKLLQQGLDTRTDPAARFVLWREACDLAANVAEPAGAYRVIRKMGQEFSISILSQKVRALEAACAAAGALDRNAPVVHSGLVLLEEAIREDDYPAAGRILKAVEALVPALKNPSLTAVVQARSKELDVFQKEYATVQDAVQVLAKDPRNAAANLTLGKFFCLVKGDWARGLPLLALGEETQWSVLAKQDLAWPAAPTEQVEMGNGWEQLAREQGADSLARDRLQERAHFWYALALPRLTGLPQTELANRMKTTAGNLELSPGLVAEYFQGNNFEHRRKSRIDHQLYFWWGTNKPDPAVEQEDFTVRWVGWLRAPRAGTYTLTTISDDGVILCLDNKPLIEHWDASKPAEKRSAVVHLTDKPHLLEVLFVQGKSFAGMRLYWAQPGSFPMQAVPARALFHDQHQHEILNFDYAAYAGKWTVRYTNKLVRDYIIDATGGVNFPQDKRGGSLMLGPNRDVILWMGAMERVRLQGGRLQVDQFSPWTNYHSGKATMTGVGTRK